MSSELRWAVTDGAAGTNAVVLPEERADARRLALHYGGHFWCSREAGGCGAALDVRAGDRARPHFRHPGDVRCPLVDRGADAGRAYEHLRYQRALTTWLVAQGHRPRVEKVPAEDGSTGLHVVVDDVSSAIEVQLSPLPDTAWRQRDDRSRRTVRHVTWLYGPGAEAAAATEAAVRGVSFALRRHSVGLSLGVRDVDHRTRWVRLTACRLTAGGFHAPGAEEACALNARRAADRREAARRVVRQARGAGQRRRAGGGREAGWTPEGTPWASTVCPLPFPG